MEWSVSELWREVNGGMRKNDLKIWDSRFANLLIDSMAEGVFTLDADGRITSWNRSMERISGHKAEEAIGRPCKMLEFSRCFHKDCASNINECGIYKHGEVEAKECLLRHKAGHEVPVVKNARVVRDEKGNILGVVETVTDLTELKRTRLKAEAAARRLGEIHHFSNIIGKSHRIKEVFTAIKAASASEATVLIQGESGTGKELVAAAIHYNSHRSKEPMMTVNCSALSESLLESELFGHAKGAFTGAIRDRIGRFEEAEGGTIFLDEIGEISPFIQVKLLRVLQEREIERVGESRKRRINIRIITATHRDLYALVQKGAFRKDLYYRLKVFPIHLPALRQRKEDIPLLVTHFIRIQNKKTGKKIRGISPAAMRILMDYDWRGNVRELENAIEHAFVLCTLDTIDIFDLPVEIRRVEYRPTSLETREAATAKAHARQKLSPDMLLKLLEACEWNKAEVARRVGVSRTAIWKYMKKWDIPLRKPAQR
jgi:PAS domain S-box-containing protein